MKIILVFVFIVLISSFIYAKESYVEEDYKDEESFIGESFQGFNIQIIAKGKVQVRNNVLEVVEEGSSFRYIRNGKEINLFENLAEGSRFKFEADKIVEAYFTTTTDGEYPLGDDLIKLPKGTLVEFKDGKVKIKLPKDKTEIPEMPKDSENEYQISSESGSVSFKGKDGNTKTYQELYWDGKGFFVKINKEEKLEIKGAVLKRAYDGLIVTIDKNNPYGLIIEDGDHLAFKLPDSKSDKIYVDLLDNRGRDYEGFYFYVNENTRILMVGSNTKDKKHYIHIVNRRNEDKTISRSPFVEILNDVQVNQDYGGFKYDSEKNEVYVRVKEGPMFQEKEAVDGSGTVDMTVVFYKSDNNDERIQYQNPGGFVNEHGKRVREARYDSETKAYYDELGNKLFGTFRYDPTNRGPLLGVSNRNEMAFGNNARFIRIPSDLYTQIGSPGLYTGISNLEVYNYLLTENGFEKMYPGTDLKGWDTKSRNWISNPENIRLLMDVMASVPPEFNLPERVDLYGYDVPGTSSIAVAISGDMSVNLPVNIKRGYFGDLLIHEMMHIQDYSGDNIDWYNLGFDDNVQIDWYARKTFKRGNNKGRALGNIGGYTETLNELIQNFAFTNKGAYFEARRKSLDYYLNVHPKYKWYRASFVYLAKKNILHRERVNELLSLGNLGYSDNDFDGYLDEVGLKGKL